MIRVCLSEDLSSLRPCDDRLRFCDVASNKALGKDASLRPCDDRLRRKK